MISRLLDCLGVQFVHVRGDSMAPTIQSGSWVIVSRSAYRRRRPERFDIVRLEDPARPGHWVLKRVVGLPGEHVCLDRDVLSVNGRWIEEPHVRHRQDGTRHEWWPGDQEYVVLGDNRSASTDSRRYGPVPRRAIRSKLMR